MFPKEERIDTHWIKEVFKFSIMLSSLSFPKSTLSCFSRDPEKIKKLIFIRILNRNKVRFTIFLKKVSMPMKCVPNSPKIDVIVL